MRLSERKQANPWAPLALTLTLLAYLIVPVTSNASNEGTLSSTLHTQQSTTQPSAPAQAKPLPAPARWRGLIGEYGPDNNILIILEKDGRLRALFKGAESES